jgi:cytochrome c biogenesis protein CcmG/thiol:disulfide interchange protein DsbE
LLIKDVVASYGGRVDFVSQNWGDSKLALRYGVKKYPVVFVNDVLIARPNDFGWYGAKGKYTPWKEKANHEKFKKDLSGMIELVMRGEKDLAAASQTLTEETEIASLPVFTMQDIEGRTLEASKLKGKIVIIEFWATWCPPCRSTLEWLGEVKKKYGEQEVVVIGVAVESEERDVRALTRPLNLPVNLVMGSEELIAPFGTLGSVPRMFVFDRQGKTAAVFYGAPDDLHEKVSSLVESLIK